jgi:hypothetical protein
MEKSASVVLEAMLTTVQIAKKSYRYCRFVWQVESFCKMPTTDMNMNATPCMTATTSDDGSGGVCYGYNYSREYWVGYGMLLSGRLERQNRISHIRTDVTVIALPLTSGPILLLRVLDAMAGIPRLQSLRAAAPWVRSANKTSNAKLTKSATAGAKTKLPVL